MIDELSDYDLETRPIPNTGYQNGYGQDHEVVASDRNFRRLLKAFNELLTEHNNLVYTHAELTERVDSLERENLP